MILWSKRKVKMRNTTVFIVIVALSAISLPVMAVNIGTYQTESEYGLLDGFKINWNRKDKSQPFMQPREESSKEERNKEKSDIKKDEYQYTKYLYDGKAVI